MIKVIDNFFDSNLHDRLVDICNSEMLGLSFVRTDANADRYLTHHVYGNFYNRPEFCSDKFSHLIFEEAWNAIENKICTNGYLNSSYINVLSYGMEAHPHIDANKPDFVTVICYMSGEWNIHWGGETVFYDKEYIRDPSHPNFYTAEIVKSILPKPNRVVFFQGNIMHSVRPLSKSFKGTRTTLMFKIQNVDIAKIMEQMT